MANPEMVETKIVKSPSEVAALEELVKEHIHKAGVALQDDDVSPEEALACLEVAVSCLHSMISDKIH